MQWWMENNNNVLGFLGLQLVGLFRVCGLYGVICCSFYLFIYLFIRFCCVVEGVGGVSVSVMVDEFDFL